MRYCHHVVCTLHTSSGWNSIPRIFSMVSHGPQIAPADTLFITKWKSGEQIKREKFDYALCSGRVTNPAPVFRSSAFLVNTLSLLLLAADVVEAGRHWNWEFIVVGVGRAAVGTVSVGQAVHELVVDSVQPIGVRKVDLCARTSERNCVKMGDCANCGLAYNKTNGRANRPHLLWNNGGSGQSLVNLWYGSNY